MTLTTATWTFSQFIRQMWDICLLYVSELSTHIGPITHTQVVHKSKQRKLTGVDVHILYTQGIPRVGLVIKRRNVGVVVYVQYS